MPTSWRVTESHWYVVQIYCINELVKKGIFMFCSQFEFQQAELEVEIENLSWKVERAEVMDVAVSIYRSGLVTPQNASLPSLSLSLSART